MGKFGHKLLSQRNQSSHLHQGATLGTLDNYRMISAGAAWHLCRLRPTPRITVCRCRVRKGSATIFAAGRLYVLEGHRPELRPTRRRVADCAEPLQPADRARPGQLQREAYRIAVLDCGPAVAARKTRGTAAGSRWMAVERALHNAHGTALESDYSARPIWRSAEPAIKGRTWSEIGTCPRTVLWQRSWRVVQPGRIRRAVDRHFRQRRPGYHHRAGFGHGECGAVQELSRCRCGKA